MCYYTLSDLVCLSFHPSFHLSIYPSIYLFIYLTIIYLSVCISIYFYFKLNNTNHLCTYYGFWFCVFVEFLCEQMVLFCICIIFKLFLWLIIFMLVSFFVSFYYIFHYYYYFMVNLILMRDKEIIWICVGGKMKKMSEKLKEAKQ